MFFGLLRQVKLGFIGLGFIVLELIKLELIGIIELELIELEFIVLVVSMGPHELENFVLGFAKLECSLTMVGDGVSN
jgi:hypothetical protein